MLKQSITPILKLHYQTLPKQIIKMNSSFDGWKQRIDTGIRDMKDTHIHIEHTIGPIDHVAKQTKMLFRNRKYNEEVVIGDQLIFEESSNQTMVDIGAKNNNLQNSQTKKIKHELSIVKTTKFCRHANQLERKLNSQSFMQVIGNILNKSAQSQLLMVIKKYLAIQSFQSVLSKDNASREEKMFFLKIEDILLKNIRQPITVRNALKVFSECDPTLIKEEELQKISQHQMIQSFLNTDSIIPKSSLINHAMNNNIQNSFGASPFQTLPQFQNHFSPKSSSANYHFQSDSAFDLINSLNLLSSGKQESLEDILDKKIGIKTNIDLDVRSLLHSNQNSRKPKLRVFLKKQADETEFKASEANLENVGKKIFKNKKMMTDFIVFKRGDQHANKKFNNYGDNWVYVYDLPYTFTNEDAYQMLKIISKKYGEIESFKVQSYQDFIQKNTKDQIHTVPFNYFEDGPKNRIKIQKQAALQKSTQKQSLSSRILQKSRNEKQFALNKSSLVFKFKSKKNKSNFLCPQMRLYGLNLPKLHNIRFQQAQSKNVVTLSMLPWGSQSSDLIKFINTSLAPLKISVTHPNCIIAKGYAFIELNNFYEAYHTKQILHNLVFQDQRIKAMLSYGSSQIVSGEFINTFEFDHYEELVKKLSNLRDDYLIRNFEPSISETADAIISNKFG